MIPYGQQNINQADINAVIDVLKSQYLTQGSKVPDFEEGIKQYTGAKHAIAVNSATSALHIACLSLGAGPGDWVWTTPNTFVASANCAEYCGAKVDFVDIDPISYNMSIHHLSEKLKLSAQENRLPKIVIPVHFSGQSAEMKAISELSKQYGFKIIEDASHAIGGIYHTKPIGSCQFSDVTIFSFHPVKIITTGEGGIALTNNIELANTMKLLRSHGVTRDVSQIKKAAPEKWYYNQIMLGFNYRMTDIQASLGISQLERLDDFVLKRNKLAERYDNLLKETVYITPYRDKSHRSACHLYVIRLPENLIHLKESIFNYLQEHGIGVNVHYIPVHTQPYYRDKNIDYGNLYESEYYYQSALTIPLHQNLTEDEQKYIVNTLKSASIEQNLINYI